MHKLGNIFDNLPKRLQPRVKTALHKVMTSRPGTGSTSGYERDRVAVRDGATTPARDRLDGAHLLPLVRAGIVFVDSVQQEEKANKPKARAA